MSNRKVPELLWQPVEQAEAFEAYPGDGNPTADSWIVRDEDGAPALLYWHSTDEQGQEVVAACRPLDDGEEIPFNRARVWGGATLTIRPDGVWSIDRHPPPETNLFVTVEHWGFNSDLGHLAAQCLQVHHESHSTPVPRLPSDTDADHAAREARRLQKLSQDVRIGVRFVQVEAPATLMYRADPPRFERAD